MVSAMKTQQSKRFEGEAGEGDFRSDGQRRSGYLIRDSNNEKLKAMQRPQEHMKQRQQPKGRMQLDVLK